MDIFLLILRYTSPTSHNITNRFAFCCVILEVVLGCGYWIFLCDFWRWLLGVVIEGGSWVWLLNAVLEVLVGY